MFGQLPRLQQLRVTLAICRAVEAALWLAEVLLLLDASTSSASLVLLQLVNPDLWALALLTYALWLPFRDSAAFAIAVQHERGLALHRALWPPNRRLTALQWTHAGIAVWRAGSLVAAIALALLHQARPPDSWRPDGVATAAGMPSNDARCMLSIGPLAPQERVLVLHPLVLPRDCLAGPIYYPIIAASPASPALVAFVDAATIAVHVVASRVIGASFVNEPR